MNYYLSRNHQNKAKNDIEVILTEMGFKGIGVKGKASQNGIFDFFATLLSVLKCPFCLRDGDILLLQYPFKKYFSLVCKLAHLRGAKVICLIHDLGSFRRKKLSAKQENKRLSNADYLIVHNEVMKNWLSDNGCKVKMGILGIFDYLSSTAAADKAIEKPFRVMYAGGLAMRKNAFLYDYGECINSYGLDLYGNGFELELAKKSECISYKGFVDSDTLIATADSSFGLVWDGASVDACTGNWGEYLRYNNPHKTSLYIRCGVPIIIWKKAALATFVEREGVGVTIDSLKELDSCFSKISIEDYAKMKENVSRISHRLSIGHYTKVAVKDAINWLAVRR